MENPTNDFKNLTPQEWKLKVQAELAGLDYNEILVWDTTEGIQVKPVYAIEDVKYHEIQPIQTTKDWRIIGRFLDSPDQDFSYLYGLKIQDNLAEKAKNLPQHLDLFFETKNPFELISKIDFSHIKNLKYLNLDIFGNFAATGNWLKSQEEDAELIHQGLNENQFEKCIEINNSIFQNAGANHIQQIAIALSHGVEYLEKFGTASANQIYFKTAVGGNYFFEIAKLRALRKLWDLILNEYDSDAETFIFVETSLRNKSVLDKQNNIIRNGLETAAAIQGKADAVYVFPFDELNSPTEFSEELASKQQLLLQKEAFFDKFEDPVAGTFFIENLTELMAKNALELFKKIEREGGFLSGLFEGSIQKMVMKSAEKEQSAFDEGKMVLIGVNKFKNPSEKPVVHSKETKNQRTIIRPLFAKRLSEKIEKTL